jgi:hypothetical protein
MKGLNLIENIVILLRIQDFSQKKSKFVQAYTKAQQKLYYI